MIMLGYILPVDVRKCLSSILTVIVTMSAVKLCVYNFFGMLIIV